MKTVIITGTTKGLGRLIEEKLLQNEELNISCISRSQVDSQGRRILKMNGDISDYYVRKEFIEKTIDRFHSIDILINNAGIVMLKSFEEYSMLDFKQIMELNVYSAYSLSQLCIKQMLSQSTGGHIINIGSTRAITGAKNKAMYSMSKFALRSMTHCINEEYKERNIASTILCPGQFNGINEQLTADMIDFMIKNNLRNCPEVIIGGQL